MQTMVSTAGSALAGGVALEPAAAAEPDELAPGAKAGPWVVDRELGRGGMGSVYGVIHEDIGKRAALKVMHRRLVCAASAERVLLEARVVNTVGHPNIVDIFETGTLEDGRPYIVMERLEGMPLSYRADEGKILPDQVISILLQICDALIAAHAVGVVHRDLKLDNVFLIDNPDDPENPKVKLLDWGIAKVISADVRHTIEGQLVGTPQYLSPEQARGANVTAQTDVYSLGVMAYEMFVEQLPFEAETSAEIMAMHLRCTPPPPSELWPDIPTSLEDLILAMLAKNAEARPTMLQVAHKLEAIRDELEQRKHDAGVNDDRPARAVTVLPTGRRSNRFIVPGAAGLAPTERAYEWPEATPRRWHLAIGALAIAASALLFLVSRDTDSASAAAALPPPSAAISPHLAERQVAAEAPIAIETAQLPTGDTLVVATHAVHQTVAQKPAKRTPRTAARKSQAKPRLDSQLDPDGTLDPYR